MNVGVRIFVVDRIERRSVVLVPDDGGEDVVMERKRLPIRVEEGTVLRVPMQDGMPDWKRAEADPAERAKRLEDLSRRMAKLREWDPGGDLEL